MRSYRTRSTLDISWAYIAALGCGIVLWLTYGIFANDPALVATNVATSGAIVTLIVFKRRFDRAERDRDASDGTPPATQTSVRRAA